MEYLQKSNYNKIPTSEIRTVDSDYTSHESSDDVSQEDDFREEETATTQEVQRSKAVGNEKLTAAEEERLQSGMRNGWLFIALNICDEFAVCLNRGGLDEVITHALLVSTSDTAFVSAACTPFGVRDSRQCQHANPAQLPQQRPEGGDAGRLPCSSSR